MTPLARRSTKVICTIGPSCSTVEQLRELMRIGMDVARLNFSHGSCQDHLNTIAILQQLRAELHQPLAIMVDTKGPEIRVLQHWQPQQFVMGERTFLTDGNSKGIPIDPVIVLQYLRPGMQVFFDDGLLHAQVVSVHPGMAEIEFLNHGTLYPRKGLNLPGCLAPLPAITEQDRQDLIAVAPAGIDLIAASFIRSAAHVHEIRSCLTGAGADTVRIIAKIENEEGINNFDEIVAAADGIMIARGDLGVELPIARIPRLQKLMIRKCVQSGKPVVTATQMLDSMIRQPRPTRAEASDVANAIIDGTSAVMLSGETAAGAYPMEAVSTMIDIIMDAEKDIELSDTSAQRQVRQYDIPTAVCLAAVKTAYSAAAKAIFVFTRTGATARLISCLRPTIPIFAFTDCSTTYHQMALLWGIIPVFLEHMEDAGSAFSGAVQLAQREEWIKLGDQVVVVAGMPFGVAGTTNSMAVETVGKIGLRHGYGVGGRVYGTLRPLEAALQQHDSIVLLEAEQAHYVAQLPKLMGAVLLSNDGSPAVEQELFSWARRFGATVICFRGETLDATLLGKAVCLDPMHGVLIHGDL